MPLYPYACENPSCHHSDDEFQKIVDVSLTQCPRCGQETYKRQVCQVHTNLKEFHKPIEMYSVAVDSLEEVREMKRRNPNVEISDDPKHPLFGVPIARTRADKMSVLRKEGFIETN